MVYDDGSIVILLLKGVDCCRIKIFCTLCLIAQCFYVQVCFNTTKADFTDVPAYLYLTCDVLTSSKLCYGRLMTV